MTFLYLPSGAMPTTSPLAVIATGNAAKTLVQVKGLVVMRVVEWGISFAGFAAAQPVQAECCDTGTVFATACTAFVEADITKLNDPTNLAATFLTFGTAASGWGAGAEGTITTVRMFDSQLPAPTNQYVKQFTQPWPVVPIGNSLRVRVLAPATVNAVAYVIVDV